MDENTRYFPKEGSRREQWQVGSADPTELATGFPPITVQSVLDALGNIQGDEVVIAGYADWEVYDDQQWAAFIADIGDVREYLEEYADQVRNGEMTDQEALDEFLSEAGGFGGAEGTSAIALSEVSEGQPPNI